MSARDEPRPLSPASKHALGVTQLAGFEPDDRFLALLREVDAGSITIDQAIQRVLDEDTHD
jgi:hypothetical protein